MPTEETSRNVPPGRVEFTVKQFRRAGATKIVVTKNNGNFDVVATIPG